MAQNDAQRTYLSLLLESGCKFVLRTFLFGKEYVWVKDRYGTIFLERVPEDDPIISIGPIDLEEVSA